MAFTTHSVYKKFKCLLICKVEQNHTNSSLKQSDKQGNMLELCQCGKPKVIIFWFVLQFYFVADSKTSDKSLHFSKFKKNNRPILILEILGFNCIRNVYKPLLPPSSNLICCYDRLNALGIFK